MRILVTGGTGFVGSNLALALEATGHDVTVLGSHGEADMSEFRGAIVYREHAQIPFDTLPRYDVLFHQGANADTSVLHREAMWEDNLVTSQLLFEHARAQGATHVVYASSTAVYGNAPTPYHEDDPVDPLNPYAESKAALDTYAMVFAKENPNIRVIGLRYCNVFGPREGHKGKMMSMVRQIALQMKEGNPRIFKWGEQEREHIYVKDVVSANMHALKATESTVLNCSTGKPVTFNDLVGMVGRAIGVDRKIEYIDNPHEKTYQRHIACDISRMKKVLGFEPQYSTEDGIRDYAASGFLLN